MIQHGFRCIHCQKAFQRKAWYDKHECEAKKRFENRHDIAVILAYKIYNHWNKRNGFNRRREETMEQFEKSFLYKTFVALARWARENAVISTFLYVDYLTEKSVPERDWMDEKTLAAYRAWIRDHENPMLQVRLTVDAIRQFCELRKMDPQTFFSSVTVADALRMVENRELMPWVLLGYETSVCELVSRFDDTRLAKLDELINTNYWLARINEQTDVTEAVNRECQNLLFPED